MLSKFVDSVKKTEFCGCTTAALWSYNYRSFVLQGAYNTI